MPKVRHIEISNFRSIKHLSWRPNQGINCLIAPGDSGKSTILDAIDWCIGARRSLQISDADFHNLNINEHISIEVTIGDLDEGLKNLEAYGLYHRGYNMASGEVIDEPELEHETVLTLRLSIGSDLEPNWHLVSDRATAQSSTRNLAWNDRQRISPTRLGSANDNNLTWRRGSILTHLADERADASAVLAQAAREARAKYGADAEVQLRQSLDAVHATAASLGINLGGPPQALIDIPSLGLGTGAIALHDPLGVPLRSLGTGSMRLLVAGLQSKVAGSASMLLVDELEYGLEPHRIIRFLGSVGAKDPVAPLQTFMTTHSPIAVRELSGDQLFVLRRGPNAHQLLKVGTEDAVQGAVRAYPDALLGRAVLVCEGASEVGLIRGFDQFVATSTKPSLMARGCSLVDGGGVTKIVGRALAFLQLGYKVAILRDDDKQPKPDEEAALLEAGGTIFKWQPGRALEDELFMSLPDTSVSAMLDKAVEDLGEETINAHIKTSSANGFDLAVIQIEALASGFSSEARVVLGTASRTKSNSWFKTVTAMEEIGRTVVAPSFNHAKVEFKEVMKAIYAWSKND